MGDIHRRDRELRLERGDVGSHLHPELGVQVRKRLVHQEDLRKPDDRPAHRDALPLASGQLAGLLVEEVGEAELVRHFARPLQPLGLLDLGDSERERDVGLDGQVRVERVVLEHHRDVAALRRQVGDVSASDQDEALVDLLETGEHPQSRRLPRARRPHEHHELAVLDVEVERVHRWDVATRVELRGLLEADVSHARLRSARPRCPARDEPARAPRDPRRAGRAPGARRRRSAERRFAGP